MLKLKHSTSSSIPALNVSSALLKDKYLSSGARDGGAVELLSLNKLIHIKKKKKKKSDN